MTHRDVPLAFIAPERAPLPFRVVAAMSGGRDLSVKVEFARGYAKLLYDREMHDQLLNEVRIVLDGMDRQRAATADVAKARGEVLQGYF